MLGITFQPRGWSCAEQHDLSDHGQGTLRDDINTGTPLVGDDNYLSQQDQTQISQESGQTSAPMFVEAAVVYVAELSCRGWL